MTRPARLVAHPWTVDDQRERGFDRPVSRFVLLVSLLFCVTATAQNRPAPTRTQVGDGVYVYQTVPYGDVGLDGNSVVIISRDGVLVFDTNGTPAAAAAVLADIRTLTDKPVRYVVNSHWHWDHWYGTEVYTQAFPAVQVIAQARTREMMMGPALAFNRPGIEQQLPAYVDLLEKKASSDPNARQRLDEARFFLEQKKNVRHTFPDVTFERALDLTLGGRRIQIRHHDRAVTPGDTFLYLPDEKILITGDLLVNPLPFALSSYPTGWLKTLEHLDGLDAATIVAGHGDPLRDEKLLHTTMAVFRELLARGKDAKARGLDADAAKAEILPFIEPLMTRMTGGNSAQNSQFRTYVVDWYLHRVYEELDGPLTNTIAPIPKS